MVHCAIMLRFTSHSWPAVEADHCLKNSLRTQCTSLVLIGLGTLLRLIDLPSMEFKGDEQEALNLGLSLLTDRPWATAAPWPETGMLSSNGVANAPLFNWIMALFWRMTSNPVAATSLVALVNCASLYPLYRWAQRRFQGELRPLVILAFAAVSPFAVIYSRKLWAQDLLLPGLVCLLWSVEWLLQGRLWRGLVGFGVASLVVGQLHQSGPIALALLPVAIGAQLFWDRWRGQPMPVFILRPSFSELVALLTVVGLNLFYWIPYFDYLRHLSPQTLAARPRLATRWPQLGWRLILQIVPHDIFYFFQEQKADFLAERVPLWSWLMRNTGYYAAMVLGVPLAAYGVVRWLSRPTAIPVLGLWWLLVLAVFAVLKIPSFPHYVLILIPLPALLMAGAFDEGRPLPAALHRSLQFARAGYVAALAMLTFGTLSWLGGRGGAAGDYGVVYSVREAQAEGLASEFLRQQPVRSEDRGPKGAASTAECHDVPIEVIWLWHWRHPGATAGPDELQLCDAWEMHDGRRVYRWRLMGQRQQESPP